MRLLRLAARRFRNLEPFDVTTDSRVVVFHGSNAQGKTNALEAIWALSSLRPLRSHRTKDLISWSHKDAAISGDVSDGTVTRTFRYELGARRKVAVDGKEARDLAIYFEGIRAIAFTPSDGEVVTGEPALRRRWLDRAVFTAQPAHLDRVRSYSRILAQKAAVLRDGRVDYTLLDVLDQQLAGAGASVAAARAEMLEQLLVHVQSSHNAIVGGPVKLELRYRTVAQGQDLQARRASLAEAIAARRHDELRRGMCLTGPHKDEVVIHLEGRSMRHFGSRGQVRSIVLALKLGELVAARARGDRPLFLLDDLSSELDRDRTARLVAQLVALDAQVFITTTDAGLVKGAVAPSDLLRVSVEGGQLRTEPG